MENVIQTHNLTKTFNLKTHTEVKAMSDPDFGLKPGEIVMIMGPKLKI